MEEFKLENFKKDYPEENLDYIPLTQKEIDSLLLLIYRNAKSKELSTVTMFQFYSENYHDKFYLEGINEENGFKKLLSFISLPLEEEKAYIIWDIDKMDCFGISSLIKYWESIWYSDSDDAVLIYLPKNKYLFTITHYEEIFVYKF